MTDHADTIRRALHHPEWDIEGQAALDALLAERRQAQRQIDTLSGRILNLEAERQQAIDALREFSTIVSGVSAATRPGQAALDHGREIARAALVKLGEKP